MDSGKIGLFIKSLRKEKNYTQKELAKMIGVTDRAVSKWERGLGCPDISLLEDLSNILGVTISELLKGERRDSNDSISNEDIIDSMYSQKKVTLNQVKSIANYIAVTSVIIFVTIIIVTNVKSIYILYRKYDMRESYQNSEEVKNNYLEYKEKIEYILNHQGKFSQKDYDIISSYLKITSLRLEEMNHSVYIDKDTYSYVELLQFYIDQQKLYTIEVNNLDLYQILLQYDINIYHHMLDYHNYKNSIQEEIFNYSNFFVQPYHSYRGTQFNQYFPSVYGFLNLLYQRELILCNDIISVGDLK